MIDKKGSGTLWTTFSAIIIVLALFYGTFNYVSVNYDSAGVADNSVYSGALSNLTESQADLQTNIDSVKGKVSNITEADSLALVAWNGLTGVAAVLRVFFDVIQIGIDVFNAIFPGLSFLPDWVKPLVEMALIIWLVLIIFGAFKGEAKT